MNPVIHFAEDDETACGIFICGSTLFFDPEDNEDMDEEDEVVSHSSVPSFVTCKHCRKTDVFKEALKQEQTEDAQGD